MRRRYDGRLMRIGTLVVRPHAWRGVPNVNAWECHDVASGRVSYPRIEAVERWPLVTPPEGEEGG